MSKASNLMKQFNWRFLLVRILVNVFALLITALLIPSIYFVDVSIRNWVFLALALGILNALVKPIVQFLTLSFIFATYGIVIIVINAIILILLARLFPNRFAVDSLLWAFVGGAIMGILSSFLETLLGLTKPIIPEEDAELRKRIEAETPGLTGLFVKTENALEKATEKRSSSKDATKAEDELATSVAVGMVEEESDIQPVEMAEESSTSAGIQAGQEAFEETPFLQEDAPAPVEPDEESIDEENVQ